MGRNWSVSAVGRATIRPLARCAVIVLVLAGMTVPSGRAPDAVRVSVAVDAAAVDAVAEPSPGTYTGEGFDACTAPSAAAMNAWLASPYRAVGIYFGGENRACAQPNLTAQWVAAQQAALWHLMPFYVGLQASCTLSDKRLRIDPANAVAQGRAQAEDAVTQATMLGLAAESVLIFDMEAYRTDDAVCRSAVLSFISAWTQRLHDLGYLSGFYSSMSSGVADQVANYNAPFYTRPDYVDFARWDGIATVSDPAIPASYWPGQRRIKQYRGDHNETWGGVTINIDNDYLAVAPIPASPFGDLTGNGWPDLLARQTSDGGLYLYPGDGAWFGGGRTVTGWGWNIMDTITRLGDVNRDGYEDVFGREKATGHLWMYPGTVSGFGARSYFGAGWNTVREVTAIGDFNRDGYPDVVAVDTAGGAMFLYTGNGASFTNRITIGGGWNGMDELAGVGDFNRDGYVDLVAREKATGYLYLYTGAGTGFNNKIYFGGGWEGLRDLAGIGDFDRDGYPDLLGIEKSTGYLNLYPGAGNGFTGRRRVGSGWAGIQPVL